jgi:uncharacterized small protein (DUF1192 family)
MSKAKAPPSAAAAPVADSELAREHKFEQDTKNPHGSAHYWQRYELATLLVSDLEPRIPALQAESASLASERDRLNATWASVKAATEAKRAEVRRADAALSEQAAQHAVEIKLHKQRVRELLTGSAASLVDDRVATLRALKLAGDEAIESERELKADRRDIAVALKEMETGHDELVRVLKLENDKSITTQRFRFEAQARELAALYNERMRVMREEMNAARETCVASVESRKAAHTAAMLAAHERAFNDMKAYFNDITHSNLDLIKVRARSARCTSHRHRLYFLFDLPPPRPSPPRAPIYTLSVPHAHSPSRKSSWTCRKRKQGTRNSSSCTRWRTSACRTRCERRWRTCSGCARSAKRTERASLRCRRQRPPSSS